MDKVQITIDWDSVWEKFDCWYNDSDEPTWEKQRKHIESLVEEQILYRQLNQE